MKQNMFRRLIYDCSWDKHSFCRQNQILFTMKTNGMLHLFPVLRIVLFLALGIVTGDGCMGFIGVWMWLAATVCALCITVLSHRHAVWQSFAILVSSFFAGGSLMTAHLYMQERTFPWGETVYKALIASTPVERGKVLTCDMIVTSVRRPFKIRASILNDNRARLLRAGDGIEALSVMEKPRNHVKSTFDYARYMIHHGYSGQTFIYKTNWQRARVERQKLTFLTRARLVALRYRNRLQSCYRRYGLSGDALSVVSAMTLGAKEDMSHRLRERYSVAGASHILALSGLHIGIIYAVLSCLFVWRRFRLSGHILVLSAVWGYVFITGMPPSAIRSAVMVTIYAFAMMCSRDRMSLNTLSVAALVMLATCPSELFDVGFQMSFMAVFFILVFYHRIYNKVPYGWRGNVMTRRFWQMTVISFVAQIGVAPLVMLYFGRVSLYFLLANFIVVPAAALIIYGAMLLLVLSFVPVLPHVVACVLSFVVDIMNVFVERLSMFPGGDISGFTIRPVQVWMIYALVFVVYGLLRFVRKVVIFGRYNRIDNR